MGSDSPCEGAIIRGMHMPKHARRHSAVSCVKMAESFASWEGTLAQPGEYAWTARLRRRCGLTSNYFDQLFKLTMLTVLQCECFIELVEFSNLLSVTFCICLCAVVCILWKFVNIFQNLNPVNKLLTVLPEWESEFTAFTTKLQHVLNLPPLCISEWCRTRISII